MALMRVKLNLTEKEILKKSWIGLNIEMKDFPYYDHNAKKIVTEEDSAKILEKLFGK